MSPKRAVITGLNERKAQESLWGHGTQLRATMLERIKDGGADFARLSFVLMIYWKRRQHLPHDAIVTGFSPATNSVD